jgi:glyoxylase-like metal-dependent hydrolase (beta-lactamase superfamily II)
MIENVLPEIQMIKNYSNSFVVVFKDYCVLIDAGMDKKAEEIVEAIRKTGKKPKFALITHAHLDHINGLARIKEEYPELIIASSQEEKNAVEGKEMILPKGMKGLFFKIFSPFIGYRGVKVDRILKEENFENFKVIATPGHTKGSLSFLLKISGKNALFAGDLILNKENKLCLAPEEFNFDKNQIIESLKKISEIKIDFLFPGHGEAIKENVNQKIKNFLSQSTQ